MGMLMVSGSQPYQLRNAGSIPVMSIFIDPPLDHLPFQQFPRAHKEVFDHMRERL